MERPGNDNHIWYMKCVAFIVNIPCCLFYPHSAILQTGTWLNKQV